MTGATIVDLVGPRLILAAIIASAVMLVLGYFISAGNSATRKTTGLIQIGSNAGPTFAAVAIAFDNDPEILGAVMAILFLQIVVGVVASSYLGRDSEKLPDQPSQASAP